jgi:hypothetical protein
MESRDYLQYYDLETYLLDTVRTRFQQDGRLSTFDFFCIVVWKSNRAKSKIARRLLSISGQTDLESAVEKLTAGLFSCANDRERLHYLWYEWGFRLPMASAVLTILYPESFTVYDTRVCTCLRDFGSLGNTANFDALWEGYLRFRQAVSQAAPARLSLRDKDRYLWAESFAEQLDANIKTCFNQGDPDE